MQILHLCPAGLATGGTEGIHNLVHYLCKCGADAQILYVGKDLSDPQPREYAKYECKYVTDIPTDFKGLLIFPEVWGNRVVDYKDYMTAINWQGVDVYYWNNPIVTHGQFLQNPDTIHIANSEYAMQHLKGLGLSPIKISDCLNDDFFTESDTNYPRSNIVLYNPVSVKMTEFQEKVMTRCTTELGVRFKPIEGYTREQLIDLFRHSKLYIDFGVFSGRERLPREAVMCGCCILTSDKGTAHYYLDNSIPDQYKIEDVETAMSMITHILVNYPACKPDFDAYRQTLRLDKQAYLGEVEKLYHEILNHNSRT